jgi:hypothetical protein
LSAPIRRALDAWQSLRRETELGGQLRLAQSHIRPDLAHVYLGHIHEREANLVVLAAGPSDGLFQPFDDARPDCGLPRRRTALRLPRRPLGTRLHIHGSRALLKFAVSFFG